MAENSNINARMTAKRRRFVSFYLKYWNGTKAARLAGYQGDGNTLAVTAHRLLRNAKVREAIEQRLATEAMDANEVLWRLGEQGRGNIANFINTDKAGGELDMDAIAKSGHLIKSVTWTKAGVRLDLYDAQAALVHIGRHLGLFTDNVKLQDWRSEVLELIKDGRITLEQVKDELGAELAEEFFKSTGLAVVESRQTESADKDENDA